MVYKGVLRKDSKEDYSEAVAIKTLKGMRSTDFVTAYIVPLLSTGFIQEELVTDLLKECVKMQQCDHPNVLKLIGVCLDGGPAPYIIMPFMPNGSLLSYLKKERETIVLDISADEEMKVRVYLHGPQHMHVGYSSRCQLTKTFKDQHYYAMLRFRAVSTMSRHVHSYRARLQ